MNSPFNIHIIGTSHIARQSLEEIKKFVLKEKPEIVAVELDAERAAALMLGEQRKLSLRDLLEIGFRGYFFARMGQYVQQKLGRMVGVLPGSEMKMALELARQEKIKVAFIDQPIKTTLQNFSRELTWKEKGRFLWDLFQGLFFASRQMKVYGLDQFDLTKVPPKKIIAKMMVQLKQHYPHVYKTLVEDRNKYMVRRLVQLIRGNPHQKILLVVGAGHEEGIRELLLKVDIIG